MLAVIGSFDPQHFYTAGAAGADFVALASVAILIERRVQ